MKEVDVYIEFNGQRVAASAEWERVDHATAMAAVKAFRTVIGKPTDLNGRKLK